MDKETMFAFVGLTLEKPSDAVERMNSCPIVDEIMDISVDDRIPNEENVFNDMDDPLMDVGTIYANMTDFRRAVKQHTIKTQFELETEKSNPDLFRGYCKAESCPWSIVARPYLSVDVTALNGRWNGQLASATALDGHNWMFPVAFRLFENACKGLENVVKAVYPWAEHRECFIHLIKKFSKRFQGPIFGHMYPAARTFCLIYHEYLMHKMYETNDRVQPFLETYHRLLWMRSKFSEDIKCDYITNNWVKDLKDLPIAELIESLRSRFMELYARKRDIGERLESHTILPIVVRHLNVLGRGDAEVTVITDRHKIIRHVVDLEQHTCSCREWQVSGKPCPHALAVITSHRNPKMEDYVHSYFSVRLFRIAYAGVSSPFPEPWLQGVTSFEKKGS
ncbi:hypothetical protein AAHA92_21937 [Salvia divinorum]|uniref:SWIM-type domain-containing protein n=1 Tax=Salvia divinorum TaxID=28513 RepID=A0ABD1GM30_SALDI